MYHLYQLPPNEITGITKKICRGSILKNYKTPMKEIREVPNGDTWPFHGMEDSAQ